MKLASIFSYQNIATPYIYGVDDLEKLELLATLNFTSNGELAFDDELYLTRWFMENDVFSSLVDFLNKTNESFIAKLADFRTDDTYQRMLPATHKVSTLGKEEFITPFHRNNHLEMCYVVEGEFKMHIQDKDVLLFPGEVLLLDRHTLHADYISTTPCKVIFIGLTEKMLDDTVLRNVNEIDLVKFLQMALIRERPDSQYIKFMPHSNKQKLEQIILSLYQEITTKDFGYQLIIRGLLTRLLNTLTVECDYYLIQSEQQNHRQLIFAEIEKYMTVHFKNLRLQDLVATFNYSADYFNKLIKENTGLTYTQFLQTIRIQKAQELLTSTNYPVHKVAIESGYSNLQFFYQLFSTHTGLTPNAYRKKHR
ncbi:helix-turn-helix domain-containing protein [Listeria costaricensis]|uniref:helix-turn-helix domain-containing protein n=1 Tax=Listeria costaricensis TaxID=2026604 RepID=UPI000C08A1EE|nr:helix-turn-helix domain-containing protein [Listeria costaricensis]